MNFNKKSISFFSFVIPAHNEEKVIEKTLACLKELDYPSTKYEVIVIENGSSDTTYERAKKFENSIFKIYTSKKKGVSKARNLGISKVSSKLNWCIVMDADVFLNPPFLKELNEYLNKNKTVDFGTTTLLPSPNTFTNRLRFASVNFADYFLGYMTAIHIIKKDLLQKAKYDEDLQFAEDLKYKRTLSKYGNYFYMKTRNVYNSARRFEKQGWMKTSLIGTYYGLISEKKRKKKEWKVIR